MMSISAVRPTGPEQVSDHLGEDRLGAYGDVFYQKLMAAHEGLEHEASIRLNARLILVMANLIGDEELLEAILAKAVGTKAV